MSSKRIVKVPQGLETIPFEISKILEGELLFEGIDLPSGVTDHLCDPNLYSVHFSDRL